MDPESLFDLLCDLARRNADNKAVLQATLNLPPAFFGRDALYVQNEVFARGLQRQYVDAPLPLLRAVLRVLAPDPLSQANIHSRDLYRRAFALILDVEEEAGRIGRGVRESVEHLLDEQRILREAKTGVPMAGLLPAWEIVHVLPRAMSNTCRIESGTEIYEAGTGVLISADCVLTAQHVVEEIRRRDTPELTVRFDFFRRLNESITIPFELAHVACESPWPGDHRINRDGSLPENCLDYAILRIPGLEKLSAGREPFRLCDWAAPKRHDDVLLVQHPDGERLHFNYRQREVDTLLPADCPTVFRYRNDTLEGSSGSPVFSGDARLIGLHHGEVRGRARNQAVSMSAIKKSLRQNVMIWTLLGESLEPDSER